MRSDIPLPRRQLTRSRLALPPDVAYIYRAQAEEDRGYLGDSWIDDMIDRGTRFLEVMAEDSEYIQIRDAEADLSFSLSLFDSSLLIDHLQVIGAVELWVDITALSYGSWASILRVAIERGVRVFVIYTEPASYTENANPLRGMRFNLSARTHGLAPLPGFVRLWPPEDEVSVLVPMLGFEGDRLQRVLEETDFDSRVTFPILGLPGFRPEYPFLSLDGNSRSLDVVPLHRNIRFARANCPFEAYLAAEDLREREGADHVTFAPIGTKPHALGALLQVLRHPNNSSIVYDHPVRSARRTSGAASLCVYAVSEFLEALPNS